MKRKIKLYSGIILTLAMCVFCAVTAAAVEAKEYSLNDLKMKISVDDSFSVFTRETPSTDPIFGELQLSYENAMQSLRVSDTYLQGVSSDGGYILTVGMTEDENSQSVVSYSRLSEAEMLSVKNSFLSNSIYTGAEIAEINGNYYFALPFADSQNEQTIYGMQYNTVENGMNINITLQTAVAPLGNNTIWVIDDAVRSIEFTEKAKAVSSFNTSDIAVWLCVAIIAVLAASALAAVILRKKKIAAPSAVQGGFDNPETNILYQFSYKRREAKRMAEEQKRIETRKMVINNIDNGGDYDVFSDGQPSPKPTEDKPGPVYNRIFSGIKKKGAENEAQETVSLPEKQNDTQEKAELK